MRQRRVSRLIAGGVSGFFFGLAACGGGSSSPTTYGGGASSTGNGPSTSSSTYGSGGGTVMGTVGSASSDTAGTSVTTGGPSSSTASGGGGSSADSTGSASSSGDTSGASASGGTGTGSSSSAMGASSSSSTGASSSSTPPPPGDGGVPGQCPWRNTAPTTVATPFAAPDNALTFTPPTIPCVLFPITNYGGKSDGTTSNTAAFAQAVAAAKAAGGGVIDVPAGTWASGPIHLDSNIELHLEAGATIAFSANASDYLPPVLTRWEGLDVMNFSPFVYALHATNVAITGSGTLLGPGSAWGGGVAAWKTGSASEDQRIYNLWLTMLTGISGPPTAAQVPTSAKMNGLRPTFVECNGCTNFLVEGITAKSSPYWCIHPLYSKNVIVRNVTVDTTAIAQNGDGTDADSCDTCLIENMKYATSDDMIAIKSGLNEVGIAVNRPSHNVVVRNISATSGHGISIGSEMSGGVDNVDVTSDTMNDLTGVQFLLRIKTLAGRGGTIQNVFLENTSGAATKNAVLITTSYGSSTITPKNPSLIPIVKDVTFKHVTGSGGVSLTGIAGTPLDTITFDNVAITGAGSCTAVKNLSINMSTLGGIPSTTTMCP